MATGVLAAILYSAEEYYAIFLKCTWYMFMWILCNCLSKRK